MSSKMQWKITGVMIGLLVAGGCATPGVSPLDAGPAEDKSGPADRQVMQAEGGFAFEQVLALAPQEISAEQAASQLVQIPESEVASGRYSVQQLRLGRFYDDDDDFFPFSRNLRNNLSYYRSGNYYLPYYRSGSTYYPYSDVLYRSRFSNLFDDYDDDDFYSPYYFRSGSRYTPYTYRSTGRTGTVLVKNVIVNIQNFAYLPSNFRLELNGTVAWLNMDNTLHTATSDFGNPRTTTGDILPGQTSAPITFFTRGRFPYHCVYHPEMRGTFTIEERPTPAPTLPPTPMPTATPMPSPTATPTPMPTATPTVSPSPY